MKKLVSFLLTLLCSSCSNGDDSVAGIDLSNLRLLETGNNTQQIVITASNPIIRNRSGVLFKIMAQLSDRGEIELYFAATSRDNRINVDRASENLNHVHRIVLENGIAGGESIELVFDLDTAAIGTIHSISAPVLLGVW